MILSEHLQVYLKTTETCQLNCKHCFTSGSNGAKVFFNPDKVINFFYRLNKEAPQVRSLNILFHGGEPMLAPLESLKEVHKYLSKLPLQVTWGIQTNLVYKLTEEYRNFFKDVFMQYGFGTSWDYDMRFGSTSPGNEKVKQAQLKLWENNVRELIKDGHFMTMIVSISKRMIEEKEPIEIINYARDLGFQNILFERITHDGNANENSDIFPKNKDQDEWLTKMWHQSIENKTYEYMNNMFLSEVVEAVVLRNHTANRCRNCEQSMLTLNATGTISGCPNSAPKDYWGHIDMNIPEMLNSDKRLKIITCEASRNPVCYTCPNFDVCNGDCHQLPWEGDLCAAPKSLMTFLKEEGNFDLYRKMLS